MYAHWSLVLGTFTQVVMSVMADGCGGIPSRGETVLYWGQNSANATESDNLTAYCTDSAGVDIIVLAFLSQYGNGNLIPSGTIGQSCNITSSGEPQGCAPLASQIETCQANGVKVFLSVGGAKGAHTLDSTTEAEQIGQNLWEAYGKPNDTTQVPRPFGETSVDGWDFNIETTAGREYYPALIERLRSNFAQDPGRAYYISGAPQCAIPEPNMQEMIASAQFDYLWVQFYNNPGCSIDGHINFDDWTRTLANTASSRAKVLIGVPAAPLAATGTTDGARYYLEPNALAPVVRQYASRPAFGGVMMWSAAFSDQNSSGGCTYTQQVKHMLRTGEPC